MKCQLAERTKDGWMHVWRTGERRCASLWQPWWSVGLIHPNVPRWIISSRFLHDFPSLLSSIPLHLSFCLTLFLTIIFPSPIFSISPFCFSSPTSISLSILSLYSTWSSLYHTLIFHHLPSFSSLSLDPLNGSHWFLFMSQNSMSPDWQEAYPLTFCIFCLIYFPAAVVLTCTLWLV